MEAADHEPAISQRFRSTGLPGAQHYALGNARYHFLLREAGLDFERVADRRRVFEACETVDGDPRSREAVRTLVDLGIVPARVPGVIGELLERRGFLIALSRSALERFDVSHGDVPGHDLKLYAPSGVPFEAIAGIEPLGDVEFRFFEELQAALARRSP
jgi:hypothetical protein